VETRRNHEGTKKARVESVHEFTVTVMVDLVDRLSGLTPAGGWEPFCRRWRVTELSIFGSALREDFRTDSDLDVLVSFEKEAPWSLWDLIAMRDELSELVGRKVDLIEREGLRNPIRKRRILETLKVVYVAGPE
jgi:predicted nucleotidyltransferase